MIAACLRSSTATAEERFGLQSIADGVFSRAQVPPSMQRDSDLRFAGQAVLLASYRLSPSLSLFYEGRISHIEGLNKGIPQIRQTYTAGILQGYLRYTTRLPSGLNLQIGKFGHPFGQFLTRNYSDQNPLIGFPLIYTHRTTIRSNQIPYSVYDLTRWQDREQTSPNYYGSSGGDGWLPLINFSYPTGVMAFGGSSRGDYRFALVNSSLSNPLNLGTPGQQPQWVVGGGVSPSQRVRIGSSYTAGPYLNTSVRSHLPAGDRWSDFTQRALGIDLQLTLRHLEFQGEAIFTNFRLPYIQQRLGASGYFLELKHTLTPRLFAAARWNQIYFDRLRESQGYDVHPRFDKNVNSLEIGLGFRLSEKLLAKTSYQFRRTVTAVDPRDDIFGIQLVYSFDVRKLMRFP